MLTHHEVRRHPDSSLDFDFYRRRAARLRAQAMREILAAKVVPVARALIAAAAVAAALYVVPAADGRGWNGPRTNGDVSAGASRPTGLLGKS